MTGYDILLDSRYSLTGVSESLSLDESLDEVAVRATVVLAVTSDLPGIGPGQSLQVLGRSGTLFDGVVWECSSLNRGRKSLTVTAYDYTIYLAKSEAEYLFPAGQTATQRLKRYAADWNLSLGDIADTKVPLAKAVHRAQPIYSMIRADLAETVRKSGGMFRSRMAGRVLHLVALGANHTPWTLMTGGNLSEVTQRRTLEGAHTRVKVLGQAAGEAASQVLVDVAAETDRYGTLQTIIQDSRVTTAAEAKAAAAEALVGMRETLSVVALDLEGIRAGDKLELDGVNHLVTRVSHNLGADPGEMRLDLASPDYVRRSFYA